MQVIFTNDKNKSKQCQDSNPGNLTPKPKLLPMTLCYKVYMKLPFQCFHLHGCGYCCVIMMLCCMQHSAMMQKRDYSLLSVFYTQRKLSFLKQHPLKNVTYLHLFAHFCRSPSPPRMNVGISSIIPQKELVRHTPLYSNSLDAKKRIG